MYSQCYNVLFQSLRILKNSDLKPYVVFVAPPNIEKLKQLRQKQGVNLSVSVSVNGSTQQGFTNTSLSLDKI